MNALDRRAGLNESRPALSANVALLRHAVVAFAADAGADRLQLENLGLAMSEAVSNAVVHAYCGHTSQGNVAVKAWLDGDWLVVTVSDDGHGMTPRGDSPGLGLGLHLIRRVADRFEIEDRAPGRGVLLRMTFALNSS